MNEVIINGTNYPLQITMGGLMMYAKKNGIKIKHIYEINFSEFTVDQMIDMLYCLIKSVALNKSLPFDLSQEQLEQAMYADESIITALINLFIKDEEAEKK